MIYQFHQPEQVHLRNHKVNNCMDILGHDNNSQCKTRNVEIVNEKCYNYSNGASSFSQPRNSNRSFTQNVYGSRCNSNTNNKGAVDVMIPLNHFINAPTSSNPEYIQRLKNKINELQQENEMLKDKYSYVSEMLSSERNNGLTYRNNNSTYEIDYQSFNELRQENLQFKKQIDILSQRIETLEAEKKQFEHDHNCNNHINNDINISGANVNNSATVETIAASRKHKANKKCNNCNCTNDNSTSNRYNRDSISYGHANAKTIMNLKKKSSNINKVKHSTCSTSKHSPKPKSAAIRKAKMKIKIPKSSALNNNGDSEHVKEQGVVKDNNYVMCSSRAEHTKEINNVYNLNTQIQMVEMNVLKLSNEFNKLINQRYCDSNIVKDVITKVSNDLINKTEELLVLYKQQHSMITVHLP